MIKYILTTFLFCMTIHYSYADTICCKYTKAIIHHNAIGDISQSGTILFLKKSIVIKGDNGLTVKFDFFMKEKRVFSGYTYYYHIMLHHPDFARLQVRLWNDSYSDNELELIGTDGESKAFFVFEADPKYFLIL